MITQSVSTTADTHYRKTSDEDTSRYIYGIGQRVYDASKALTSVTHFREPKARHVANLYYCVILSVLRTLHEAYDMGKQHTRIFWESAQDVETARGLLWHVITLLEKTSVSLDGVSNTSRMPSVLRGMMRCAAHDLDRAVAHLNSACDTASIADPDFFGKG